MPAHNPPLSRSNCAHPFHGIYIPNVGSQSSNVTSGFNVPNQNSSANTTVIPGQDAQTQNTFNYISCGIYPVDKNNFFMKIWNFT